MTFSKLLALPALLLFPFALIACGNDDDNTIDPANGAGATPTEVQQTPVADPGDSDEPGLPGDVPPPPGGVDDFDIDGAQATENGVLYHDHVTGTGAETTAASSVLVHYQGVFVDGTLFDSSHLRGQPAQFALSEVIPGFAEGLIGMREGGVRLMFVPSELGYGPEGFAGAIPPDADLIFEVELLEVR